VRGNVRKPEFTGADGRGREVIYSEEGSEKLGQSPFERTYNEI